MERILVVKLYAIGDFVMSLPAMGLLRAVRPDAEIHLLTGRLLAPLAGLTAPVDRIIGIEERFLGRSPRSLGLVPGALGLRKEGYSSAYLLHRILPLRLFLLLTGSRRRIGQGTSTLGLTAAVPFETGEQEHDSQRYARVFGWNGRDPLPVPEFGAGRTLSGDILPNTGGRGFVAVAPGGGRSIVRRTEGKRWPQERFGEVIRLLHGEGYTTVLLGSVEDGESLGELRGNLPVGSLDMTGRTSIVEAACVLSRCRMLLTNDSSLMHLAGLAGTPTLTLFGPTDPSRVGVFPPSVHHRHLTPEGVPCSPCHPPAAVEDCASPLCMLSITTDMVWEVLTEMLAGDGEDHPSGSSRRE
jgi:ADP-heptose:LPS heptosyltransferase